MGLQRNIPPFRADIVGSYLRPAKLKKAREQYYNNKISFSDLQEVENDTIADLVKKQEEVGLKVATDGEFRRSWWHLDFMWGFNGVEKILTDKVVSFKGATIRSETAKITGPINGENHPFVEHFKFLNSLVSKNIVAKQAFPAPAQFYSQFVKYPEHNEVLKNLYPTEKDFIQAIAIAYKTVINDLYKAGCRYIQLDDTNWAYIADSKNWEKYENPEKKLKEFATKCLDVNNLVLNDLPKDLVVTTHVCRGNFKSTWIFSGSYDPISEYLFKKENVDAYFLEYDTDRAGDFEALKDIPNNKLVVLGLVTSKAPGLESSESIIARIKEATKYIPLDRLCLSPQCGFASTEEGNILTEEEQWKKIKLIVDISNKVWN